ncbi:MAG: hypothetical protein NZ602_05180 [Thermoguttaceae bacterium]|nr:hypothetical protein [Thermoguttaceae bacterium]MDW8038309.1 hypothetical protein [Thermoguttaceae bacterium]
MKREARFLCFGYIFLGVTFGLWGWAGCGGGSRESLQREQSSLKPLAILYGQYIGQNRGQPPPNEEAFRKFVEQEAPKIKGQFAFSTVEELFISPRDGKPYKILYGEAAKKGPPGPAGSPVIAYEQEGRGGRRWVASAMGAIEEVDEARFKQLVPGGP